MIEELYQDVILRSSRETRHKGDLRGFPCVQDICLSNPLCGDKLHLWLQLEDGLVKDVKFGAQGCMISQAATSLLLDVVKGKSVHDAKVVLSQFRELIQSQEEADCENCLGDLVVLKGVRRFPSRTRCALLAAEALERLLDDRVSVSSCDA